MLRSPQVTFSLFKSLAVLLLPLLLSSCALRISVKKPPRDKPFVYKTNIRVEGNESNGDKQELQSRLLNQLDDSLKLRVRSYPLWKVIIQPPAFDTNAVRRSESYMRALLNSLGYFSSTIRDTFFIEKVGSQQRVWIDFRVNPGKGLKFDSVGYALDIPQWQRLVLANRHESLLKKGDRYNKLIVGKELDRVIELLRNNGYYKVSKEDIYAEADTVAFGLIDPTLDPFEQAILLEQLRKKKENPTITVVVRQRPLRDSSHSRPYYINAVTIYPDMPAVTDTLSTPTYDTTQIGKFTIISQSNKYRKNFLLQYSGLQPGDLYSQKNYFKTITTFNQLGAWQQANVDVFENPENDSTLDIQVTLYPAKKYGLVLDLETTVNTLGNNPAFVATSNLVGLGVNLGLRNKNFAKQSIQSTTNARFGVELGKNFVQTIQSSVGQNFYFPKIISPFRVKRQDSSRTILSFNAAYTDRRIFYRLASLNLSWGYEWARRNHIWLYRPINLEYTKLTGDSIRKLQEKNTLLRYAFNDGTVIGQQLVYRWQKISGNNTHAVRAAFEESGAIFGFIKKLDIQGKLFRFVKTDVQYTYTLRFRRSALAFRAMGGIGIAYGDSSETVKEKTLPFFKQFYAGGPNSMRAWQVRQLGPGSNKSAAVNTFDKFGDIQLETNVEYRFPLATIAGVKVGSALYVDAGNVWLRKTYGDPTLTDADFNFSRLGQDIAIGTGTGFRMDFSYFLIRLDYAYKVKDPNRIVDPNKWFYDWRLFNGQLQLGINYPF